MAAEKNPTEEPKSDKRKTNKDDLFFMQCAECAAPFILRILSTIKDVAVIVHSPAGCAASFADFNRRYRIGLKKRGLPVQNARLISTNLNETDVICGIDGKLEEAIDETLKRFNPRAIFIAASCGSGVTGYEIQQVIEQLKGRHTIPLATVVCEVYGPKKWGSGFQARKHGLFTKIVKPAHRKSEFYNVIDFSGDETTKKLLSETGVKWNFISCYEDYECLESMAQAKATFRITSDRFSIYLANYLEQEFGVSNIEVTMPCGCQATDLCLRKIGKAVGREEVFEKIISRQRELYEPELAKLRRELKGLRALPLVMGDLNENSVISMLKELGLQVCAGKEGYASTQISQGYQLIQPVHMLKPDVIIVQHYSVTSWAAKLGQPTFWMEEDHLFFGYRGMVRFGQKLADVVANPHFLRRLAQHVELPYTDWWMNREMLQEVKNHE